MSDVREEAWHYEYYHLQTIVTGYNSDCIAIKNWSVTASAVAIGYAYVENHWELLLVSAAGALTFLLTEAYWRANQRVFVNRIREIEDALQPPSSTASPAPQLPVPAFLPGGRASPDISNSWRRHWGKESFRVDVRHAGQAALRMRTWLPHGVIIVAAVVLLIFARPKESSSEPNAPYSTTVYQRSSTGTPEVAAPESPPAGH